MESINKFLECEDGIYFGKPLKNGCISKTAVKVEDKDIVYLFINYLKRYCLANNKNLLEIVNEDDVPVMEAKLHIIGIK